MQYYHNLYVSSSLQGKQEQILKNIQNNTIQFNKYLIVLKEFGKNPLEIYDSVLRVQKLLQDDHVLLVGVADGYDEALELTRRITQEVYDATAGTDIKGYLISQQQKYEESVGQN